MELSKKATLLNRKVTPGILGVSGGYPGGQAHSLPLTPLF